jgi:Zn-dependent protease with chaperone function
MFALRGIAISSSVFFAFYGALSLVVCVAWRRVYLIGQRSSAQNCADLLFCLRTAPFVLAAAVTLVLTLPSFLLFEPRSVAEPMGPAPVALGLCGLAVLLGGIWNAIIALLRVSRTIARWSCGARAFAGSPLNSRQSVSVLLTSAPAPPLTAAGILRPKVWLSGAAEFVLTERELQSALRHEVVHLRRRDNLRKLLLRMVVLPGMAQLDSAWREATEMAADDAAVSTASQALDLAAAVIKLSRLAPLEPPAELTTALVHSPSACVNARVERLIAWTEPRQRPTPGYSLGLGLCAAATTLATLAVTYSTLLVKVHAATEWLVR